MDETITTVILDFDGQNNKEKVYNEVSTIQRFLKGKGVNSIIVSSTNKGYHFYIQIPPTHFSRDYLDYEQKDRNKIFVTFTKYLIEYDSLPTSSLDKTNTHAGLKGNIRIIGSTHPKTMEQVSIIKGEFIENDADYHDQCHRYVEGKYKLAVKQFEVSRKIEQKRIDRQMAINKAKKIPNIIEENDLRQILPNIYGGTVRKYDGYIFMNCPWHVDRNPSLMVTKEWFYCTGCGEKGNIWTLLKKRKLRL